MEASNEEVLVQDAPGDQAVELEELTHAHASQVAMIKRYGFTPQQAKEMCLYLWT